MKKSVYTKQYFILTDLIKETTELGGFIEITRNCTKFIIKDKCNFYRFFALFRSKYLKLYKLFYGEVNFKYTIVSNECYISIDDDEFLKSEIARYGNEYLFKFDIDVDKVFPDLYLDECYPDPFNENLPHIHFSNMFKSCGYWTLYEGDVVYRDIDFGSFERSIFNVLYLVLTYNCTIVLELI